MVCQAGEVARVADLRATYPWRVVQSAERLTLDQEVGGSSPPPPARKCVLPPEAFRFDVG